jgi:thymidylate synthase (FAD)
MNREELLNKYKEPINVGKHGFIQLIDIMGDDAAIAQAARTSYGEGTKTTNPDRELIRYLVRNKHTSPIEMCEIKLCIQAPIYVFRQWLRHRTASVNEYSLRYSESLDLYETTDETKWRHQSKSNKQGSEGLLHTMENPDGLSPQEDIDKWYSSGTYASYLEGWSLTEAKDTYYQLLTKGGVAREQARKVLPLSTYSRCYWKIDLHNLLNFLKLRMDEHAQKEIRDYANAIWAIIQDWVPDTSEAFRDYVFEAVTFSASELKVLCFLANPNGIGMYRGQHLLSKDEAFRVNLFTTCGLTSKTERIEFMKKLKKLLDNNETTSTT